MDDRNRGAFDFELDLFVGKYPGAKFEAKNRAAFWITLQFFSLEIASGALKKASEENPRYMPSASMVREYAVILEREHRDREEAEKKRRAEEKAAREYRNPAPDDPEDQLDYIYRTNNPFEALARKWECQSKKLGLDPGRATPKNIAESRLSEFWDTWAKASKAAAA